VSCDYQRNIHSHMIVFAKCCNCHQPNETFNADANIGHRFAILMANVGALRPYRASGAG
jgi:translation initiation factor 2 beta subunit (eIF-2beta)/eIF-5